MPSRPRNSRHLSHLLTVPHAAPQPLVPFDRLVTARKHTVGRLDAPDHTRARMAMTSVGLDFTAIPRAVLSAAVGVVHTVERVVKGEERMRTARGNAWEAVCADRARALQQAEVDRLVAALATGRDP